MKHKVDHFQIVAFISDIWEVGRQILINFFDLFSILKKSFKININTRTREGCWGEYKSAVSSAGKMHLSFHAKYGIITVQYLFLKSTQTNMIMPRDFHCAQCFDYYGIKWVINGFS